MAKIDFEKVAKHLREKWGEDKKCPMCGSPNWGIQSATFELRDWNPTAMIAAGQVFPVVPVVCSNCGNTILVSAIVAGVVSPGAPQ